MPQHFPGHQRARIALNSFTNSRGVYFESTVPVSTIRILYIPQAPLRKLKQSACVCHQKLWDKKNKRNEIHVISSMRFTISRILFSRQATSVDETDNSRPVWIFHFTS